MEAKKKLLTYAGLQALEDELEHLKVVKRKEVAGKIKEAREQGDLSENAEYDAAKEAQGLLEMKIVKLQQLIMNARVLDESKMDTSKVLLLSTVKIKNLNTKSIMTYTIVSEKEANLKQGKISVTSPIAKGLLGKSVGDKVEIQVPAGKVMFEIVEITRL